MGKNHNVSSPQDELGRNPHQDRLNTKSQKFATTHPTFFLVFTCAYTHINTQTTV